MKNTWKENFLKSFYRLHLFEVGRIMRQNKITILCYHRFAVTAGTDGALAANLFNTHLRYLKKHFTAISFKEMSSLLDGSLHVRNPLIMTVDDGYYDFIEVALPLLKRYEIPATLFVTTRFADGETWLWPDIIKYAIQKTFRAKVQPFDSGTELPLTTEVERQVASNRIISSCKRLDEDKKVAFLSDLADRLNVRIPPLPSAEFRPAKWDDLRQIDGGLIEVGAHTLTHPILSRVSKERAETEIAESKKCIERELDRKVIAFSYPNGIQGDYSMVNKEVLRKNGYSFAVTCNFGFNTHDSDPLELNRIVAQFEVERFAKTVSGFESLQQKLWRIMGQTGANQVGT